MRKMLYITRNLPPLLGGMERLNVNIASILSKHLDLFVIGPNGSSQYLHNAKVLECNANRLPHFLWVSLYHSLKLSIKIKFQWVFCGSGITILAGFIASKMSGAKLVCYLHGLDIIVDNFLYQKLFLFFIRKSSLIIVNSYHTRSLAIDAGISQEKIVVIYPGVDIPVVLDNINNIHVRSKKPELLMVGRITARKGIVEFIENSMPLLKLKWPEIQLRIIGEEPKNALKQYSSCLQRIKAAIQANNLWENVVLRGRVSDEEMHESYLRADAFIFPVLSIPGDVEGFGMVAIEAASHGVPTLAFKVGGVPDAVANGESGWLVTEGDYVGLTNKIISVLGKSKDDLPSSTSCRNFATKFSWVEVEKKLLRILDDEL
jgi:phosphatidyl-myo-inositol dimannoside synthase